MAYIGQSIKNGTFTDLSFSGTFNSSTTAFNLGTQVGSPAQLLVSKNGVIQRPGTDYTLATGGTQISFTTAPASGDSIFIVEISGAVGGTITPSDNSVGVDQLNLSDGSSGQFIRTDGSGTLSFASVSSALDDITTGDAASTLATSAGNITIDAQGSDTDIIFKGTDGSSDITMLTLDGSDAGAATLNNGLTLSDGNITFSGSGHGIHLGVTSATAANLLDDYEFGTWTPTLTNFSTSGTVTTVGRYVKSGRMVVAIGSMKAATSIAHDTSALVAGFPFAGPLTDIGTGSFAFASNAGGNDSGILFCDLVSSRVFFPSSMNTTSSNELCVFTVTYEAAS
jgi:hypothetical protein